MESPIQPDVEIHELHKTVKEKFPDIHTILDYDDGGRETFIQIFYMEQMIIVRHRMDWSIAVVPTGGGIAPVVRLQDMEGAIKEVLAILGAIKS